MNASSDFTGPSLSFAVTGEGVVLDPATGTVRITAARLAEGLDVIATDAGGVERRFRLTLAPLAVAPALVAGPSLTGEARIGAAVGVDPGSWSGTPVPGLTLQWLLDGAEIPGAEGPAYAPVPADDGGALACRVTATNAAGAAEAVTPALTVRHVAPVAAGGLPDLELVQGLAAEMPAAADFTGAGLVFSVSGAGAVIDSATGLVTLAADALLDGELITVTATNSGGSASSSFRVSVVAAPAAPVLVAAPALAGSGRIGTAVSVASGSWSGWPAPALGFQWCADGAEIAGATGAAYTPAPADDLKALTCRVTANNAVGSAAAVTAALTVTYVPPVARGLLPEEIFDEGSGDQVVDAAADFEGENLSFGVAGAGARVDPMTGRVTIPTDEPLEDLVTVTATNSGGAAESAFQVTVEAGEEIPEAPGELAAAEWEIVYGPDPSAPATYPHVMMFRLKGAERIARTERLVWSGNPDSALWPAPQGLMGRAVKASGYADAGSPHHGVWLQRNALDRIASWYDRSGQIGDAHSIALRVSEDDAGSVAYEAAVFSLNSDQKATVIPAPGRAGADEWQLFGLDYDAAWAGSPPSDGEQASVGLWWCEADPDRLYHSIDVGCNLQVSLDQGRYWRTLKSRGRTKASYGLFGLASDPFDRDRIIGVNSRIWSVMDVGAIWLSEDGGISWSPRWSPDDGRSVGYASNDRVAVAFDRTSYDAGLGHCTRVYAVTTHDGHDTAQDMLGRNRLLRSTDGGVSWTVIWADNPTTPLLGSDLCGIRLWPNDPGKALLTGTRVAVATGLTGAAASVSRIAGLNGPSAGRPFISADGKTVLLHNAGNLWRSTTGGGNNSFAIRNSDLAGRMDKCWVAPDGSGAIAYVHETGFKEWFWSGDGIRFTRSDYVQPGSRTNQHQVQGSSNMLSATFHPTDPQKFVFANVSKPMVTTDGGRTFRPGFGMGGIHFKGWAGQDCAHPTDPGKFIIGVHDKGAYVYRGNGQFGALPKFRKDIGTEQDNSFATAVNPFDGRTLLMQVGMENSGQLVRCADIWKWPLAGSDFQIVDAANLRRSGTCWDIGDANVAYSGNKRSTDKGVTWSVLTAASAVDAEIMGSSRTLAGGKPVLYFTRSSQGTAIYRSLDRGATLVQVWSGWKTSTGSFVPFDVDPGDPQVIYLPGDPAKPATSHIVKVNTASGQVTHINILGGAPVTSERWQIVNILCDRHPGTGATILYVRTHAHDTGQILLTSVDGGASWTDISAGWPSCSNSNSMRLQRSTGLLFVGTTYGLYVRKPPYAVPTGANNFFDALRATASDAAWPVNHLEAYP